MRRSCGIAVLALALLVPNGPATTQEPEPILYSAYRYGGRSAGAAIFMLAPGGERVRLTGSRSFNVEPVWSPDRARVAFVHHARPRNPDVWIMDADGTDKVRLTRGPRDDVYPQWSPDGTHIAWLKARPGSSLGRIYVMHPDGHDKIAVSEEGFLAVQPTWSPNSRLVAYVARNPCPQCRPETEIHVIDGHSDEATPMVVTSNRVDDVNPTWSPDGSRIAVARERDDGADLFTVAMDGSGEQQVTDLDGYALLPRWSPDGSEIAFTLLVDDQNFHTRLGVVHVATGLERLLTDVATGGIFPDWSPDGGRIAFLGFHDGANELGYVNRDGTGLTRLTRSNVDEAWLDW